MRTLADAIERIGTVSDRGYRFVLDDKWTETFLPFSEVERLTALGGGGLQALGLRKGDRVALILPDNDTFVLTFLAALRAGIIPVPIYPPTGVGQLSGYLDNTRHIIGKSGARVVVTTAMIKQLLGAVQAACPKLERVVTYVSLAESTVRVRPEQISPDDTAFLQFTSGSTSRPKGVVLTHANLLANARNIVEIGLEASAQDDRGVTWLPLFHDMGLIGFVLSPLIRGINVTFMSPLMFLKRPASWLQAISRYKGTISFGPNFAYALAIKRSRPKDLEGLDLSHWRVAGCGAEPIRPETLDSFAEAFKAIGFRREAFLPAYGMAESTLAISFSKGLFTDSVRASTLWSEGRAAPAEIDTTQDVLRLTSCGGEFDRHQIGVFAIDDETGAQPLGERVVGELRLKGPSVTPGYFQEPELTSQAFAGGWFKTGDLGYLADGNVYICGRSKEVVIISGRNFYPQDIEWEASQIEGVRKGNVVCFGTSGESSDREKVVVVFETSIEDGVQRGAMCTAIRSRVQDTVGVAIDDVVPVAPGILPKTSSGKLQRTRTRDLYESDELSERKSARGVDRVDQAKHLARSQLEYLKLAVFGGRGKKGS
jgi:acyl-CoA synthetase (AMP-forming)/AMP-acid ligase II